MAVNKGVYGGFASVNLRKPDLMQEDPKKGDYVKGKEEFLAQAGSGSGQNVELDTTLTQSGKAADAKAVGDKFAEITGISLIEPAWGDIPKTFFGAPLQQTKDETVCEFWYYSKTLKFHGWAKIKAQGNSTMQWPKKNQSVKLFSDKECTEKLKINFKGWGKQNKFVIKAYWADLTQTRDVGSVRLEADCAKTRDDYEDMPELLRTSPNMGAVDGFPVVVYADGIYQGRYMWNIPKDKWTYNMDDELDEHCMLCSENYDSGCFRAPAKIDGTDWTDEIHDTVPASILTRWNEVIDFVMHSTDEEFVANLGNYINVNSLIDRHLMGLYSCDYDGYGKNQGYVTYNGQKWWAVPYDKDGTWGAYWNGLKMLPWDYPRSSYEDYTSPQSSGQGNLLYIRLEGLFANRLKTRWDVLKVTVLSVANTVARLRELADIMPPHLIAEDYAATTAGGAYLDMPQKTTNTIQQIQNFVAKRHAWMDEYITGLRYAPATSISLDQTNLTIDSKSPVTLTATVEPSDTTDTVVWESTNTAVATVEGGVVTPVSNGNTVIRVTAGNVSAECAVTVQYAERPCTSISLDKTNLTFNGKGQQTLVATPVPSNTTDDIAWESSAPEIATVDNGVVTAVDNGSATITVRCGDQSATCAVDVSGIVPNIMKGVGWSYGYLDADGKVVTDSGFITTDAFSVADYAGKNVIMRHSAYYNWSQRMAVYNSTGAKIQREQTPQLAPYLIPLNVSADTMRITAKPVEGISVSLSTFETEDMGFQSLPIVHANAQYNNSTGELVTPSNASIRHVPVTPGEMYYTNRLWSASVWLDADKQYISAVTGLVNGNACVFVAPEGAAYLGAASNLTTSGLWRVTAETIVGEATFNGFE